MILSNSSEMDAGSFTSDFLKNLTENQYCKIVGYIRKVPHLNNPPNRGLIETLISISQLSNGQAGESALECIIQLVRERGTNLAMPEEFAISLSARQLAQLNDSIDRLQRLQLRASINKYPTFFFETQDMKALWKTYINRSIEVPISRSSRVCALGSCFAVNISKHLNAKGYNSTAFELGELVNNVYTNRFIVESIRDRTSISDEVEKLQPGFRYNVEQLANNLREATHIVFTVGLSLAFYSEMGVPLREPIYSFRRVHYQGYKMKPIPLEACKNEFKSLIGAMKMINPKAEIIISLSPIPLDGVIDMAISVIEADCLSKSIGRATIGYLLEEAADLFYYFPSFELVRWIGANQRVGLFGDSTNDGAIRHVTTSIIMDILDIFISANCID